ncbi:MAG: hypothetical protein R3320_11930 [Nitriliruptorales bacterium]|nr:hypothetical protein [Nitriliruptorales bacterium]
MGGARQWVSVEDIFESIENEETARQADALNGQRDKIGEVIRQHAGRARRLREERHTPTS